VCVNSGVMASLRLLLLLAAMGCAACQMSIRGPSTPTEPRCILALSPGMGLHEPNHKLTWYEKHRAQVVQLDSRDRCPAAAPVLSSRLMAVEVHRWPQEPLCHRWPGSLGLEVSRVERASSLPSLGQEGTELFSL
jgi:hypothetical protein